MNKIFPTFNQTTRRHGDTETPLRVTVSLVLLVILFVLAGCDSITIPRVQDTPTPEPTQVAMPITPTAIPPIPTPDFPDGGAITIGVIGKNSLELNVMPAFVQDAVFDSLLQPDPQTGSLKPSLAESFQVSPDATTFTFRLRADVRWHNDEPLTANDVVATITAFSSANFRGTPVTDFGTNVRVTAPDAQTVQITFSDGYCPALTSIGTMPIVPRAVATSANFPKLTPAQMIGTGALKFVTAKNEEIALERNLDHWHGKPGIETWRVRLFDDANAMRDAFKSNQIDTMPAAPTDYSAIKNLPDARITPMDSSEAVSLLFNFDSIALNDPRVRQAIIYATDRNQLMTDLQGQATPLDALTLPKFWANTTPLPRYAFDLAKAKQMLADAGWVDSGDGIAKNSGKPLRVELWTESDHPLLEPLAFRLREMLARVGIQATLHLDDRPGWLTRAFQHRFDLLLFTRKIPLDPDQRWFWQSSQNVKGDGLNFGSYNSPRVDTLIRDSLRVNACEPTARASVFGEINRNLIPDAPAEFLFATKRYWVARENIFGLAPSSFASDTWNLEQWRVRK